MARSVLNTTLEFGLVSVPIKVMPVESKQEVDLDNAIALTEITGAKISTVYHACSQLLIDAVTKLAIARDGATFVKGRFESKPDKDDRSTWSDFKAIDPDALAAIKAETKLDAFAIEGFIPMAEVPTERVKGCYFLAPEKGMGKQLKLLHDALAATNRAGILKIALKERQHPAVVYAKNGGLFMNTLAWAEDFQTANEAGDAFAGAEVAPNMLAMAMTLIEQMELDADALDGLTDDLRPKKEALLEAALAGETIEVTPKEDPKESAGDLMAKLEASLAAAGPKAKAAKAKKKTAAKKVAA